MYITIRSEPTAVSYMIDLYKQKENENRTYGGSQNDGFKGSKVKL